MSVFLIKGVRRSDGAKCELLIHAQDEKSAENSAIEMGISYSSITVTEDLADPTSKRLVSGGSFDLISTYSRTLLIGLILLMIGQGGFLLWLLLSNGVQGQIERLGAALSLAFGFTFTAVGVVLLAWDKNRT